MEFEIWQAKNANSALTECENRANIRIMSGENRITIPIPKAVHDALENRSQEKGTSKWWEARAVLIAELAPAAMKKSSANAASKIRSFRKP